MAYTYRKTGEPYPKNNINVSHDGKRIARIYQYSSGPEDGLWGWFGRWSGPGHSGRADSLEEALEAVKFMHQKMIEGGGEHRWPDHTVSRLLE